METARSLRSLAELAVVLCPTRVQSDHGLIIMTLTLTPTLDPWDPMTPTLNPLGSYDPNPGPPWDPMTLSLERGLSVGGAIYRTLGYSLSLPRSRPT